MAIQTRDEAQDKFSRRVDKTLFKKKKYVPLSQESWDDLSRRGASLAEQEEWIKLRRRQKEREDNIKNS
jgi:predicted nuclease with RNAse H fold